MKFQFVGNSKCLKDEISSPLPPETKSALSRGHKRKSSEELESTRVKRVRFAEEVEAERLLKERAEQKFKKPKKRPYRATRLLTAIISFFVEPARTVAK